MKLKLLYTLILILCMSTFASSRNECTHPMVDGSPCKKVNPVKEVKDLTKEITEEKEEFSTFQFAKYLYI